MKAGTIKTLTVTATSAGALDTAVAAAVAALKEVSYVDAKFALVYDGAVVTYAVCLFYVG